MKEHYLQWLPPRTDGSDPPRWAVHVTDCGTYRIDYDANLGTYTPKKVVRMATERGSPVTEWNCNSIAAPQATLDDAMNAVNLYHCNLHNLVLA